MRVVFLVDGFNVYHSAVDVEQVTRQGVKWLDYNSLFSAYRYLLGRNTTIEAIYYFTALAYHLNRPEVVRRHETYIKCLQDTGVKVHRGRFKAKSPVTCRNCGHVTNRYEEKETDVAIASKLIEVLYNNDCDSVVLVTGDTDLAPAFKTAQRLFPSKKVIFAFPYRRQNTELAKMAPGSFKINRDNYARHQLPDPFSLSDGTMIAKPSTW